MSETQTIKIGDIIKLTEKGFEYNREVIEELVKRGIAYARDGDLILLVREGKMVNLTTFAKFVDAVMMLQKFGSDCKFVSFVVTLENYSELKDLVILDNNTLAKLPEDLAFNIEYAPGCE